MPPSSLPRPGTPLRRWASRSQPTFDLAKMMGFKQEAIDGNTKGIDFLFKKNKVTVFRGAGKIAGPGKVDVARPDRLRRKISSSPPAPMWRSSRASRSTRSRSSRPPGRSNSTRGSATLAVIGAGVIGLELGSVYARLGAKVTVIEYLDRILPGMDREVAKNFQRLLQKQGFAFKLSSKVTSAAKTKTGVSLQVEPAAGGAAETHRGRCGAGGRRPYARTRKVSGCETAGVKRDAKGRIEVDGHFATSVKGVYAIGDVIRGPMLAHKAEDEGMALAEILAGQAGHVNYDVIPGVVYTSPEVAASARPRKSSKAAGIDYKAGKFLFLANGRAKANQTTDGFVKILADARPTGCWAAISSAPWRAN